MCLQKRFGIQEIGVWRSIDNFKLAITVASGFCQGIAENQWDASRRLVDQCSALPMGWPLPVGCLSVCRLSYLALFFPFLAFLGTIGRPRVPCREACLLLPPTQGDTSPWWHLSKVAELWDETTNGGSSGAWHQEGQCSRTTKDNTINQPWRAMGMGSSLAKDGLMHSAVTLFPIWGFFLKYQENKALQEHQAVKSRKPENSKLMLIL